ncbi:hypothetical protein GWK47_041145 [Chionoecetes opilio]|uniref:Uncharacterized protein n=1 Tax=Chionoecetes opilio TaxID=41210 RepID=A0A8J4YA59_CHIOP|nr:hypothetical protein GWK47_041145 [Chionoecetes opilio]
MMSHSVSPVATSSPSSGQESCTSSASTTPPPPFDGPIIPSSPLPCSSSPVPVSYVQGLCQDDSSPLPTPPSSLSSSSEPSSSLPLPQHFSRSAAAASLFSDNNNSFFSSGPALPLQRTSPPLPLASTSLQQQQQQPKQQNQQQQNQHQPQQQQQTQQQPSQPPLHSKRVTNHQHTRGSTPDWTNKSSEVFDMDGVFPSQSHTNGTWNSIFDFEKSDDLPTSSNFVDDELGFDPFEETNKALAEDIKIEQKQQQLRNQHQISQHLHHHHHHQTQLQPQHQQHQHQQIRTGIKSLMDYSSSGQSRARLPPPGFNGLSSFNSYGLPRQSQPEQGKLLPPFLGGLPNNPSLGTPGIGSGPTVPPPMNGMVGSSGLGVPPGLGGNLLGSNNSGGLGSGGLPGGITNNMPQHLVTPTPLLSMDTPLSASQGPPGIGLPKGDAFLLKDLENGLRSMLPTISSVSTMNTLNTVNTLNSLAGGASNQTSQNNPLANFLNMAHQHQQQQHQQQHHHQQQKQQQQQQQQQHPSQQSLLHQLTMSSLATSHKGMLFLTCNLAVGR